MEKDILINYKFEGKKLEVITFPDPILSKKALPVENFDGELLELCKNMLYTMYKAPGIGLAAPQIGISHRFFVLDVDYDREKVTTSDGTEDYSYTDFNPLIVINPVFKEMSGESIREEGCLSVPGVYEEVKRSSDVLIEYQDLKGEKHELRADGLLAICLQHEFDHLEGKIFLERLSLLKRNFFKKKLIKAKMRDNE